MGHKAHHRGGGRSEGGAVGEQVPEEARGARCQLPDADNDLGGNYVWQPRGSTQVNVAWGLASDGKSEESERERLPAERA